MTAAANAAAEEMATGARTTPSMEGARYRFSAIMASSSAVHPIAENAKLEAAAKAKLAPRKPLNDVEGTIGEEKAAVEASQIVGEAKAAATATPPATYPEEENSIRSSSI